MASEKGKKGKKGKKGARRYSRLLKPFFFNLGPQEPIACKPFPPRTPPPRANGEERHVGIPKVEFLVRLGGSSGLQNMVPGGIVHFLWRVAGL